MYLDLARELNKLWIIITTVIPILFGMLGKFPTKKKKKKKRLEVSLIREEKAQQC